MNCPKCGSKMFEFPILEEREKILSYFICIDCVPYVRIIKHCDWRMPKYVGEDLSNQKLVLWCTKMDAKCNVESCPITGYVFCPQIREWQEQEADWVKGQNFNFEDECAECPDRDKCKANPRQKELDEQLEGDLY